MALVALALISSLVTLTVRDFSAVTAVIMFATPWLVRLSLISAGWILLRPQKWAFRLLFGVVVLHGLTDAGRSFSMRPLSLPQGGFEVTLWNAGRRLNDMGEAWRDLAGPETRLIVLNEAGRFSDENWSKFKATLPGFTWERLGGGILVGVKGRIARNENLSNLPRFHCHRLEVEVDDRSYRVVVVDIPSDPWRLREPYLDRVHAVANGTRTLVLGDFNTPPSSRGYDQWVTRRDLVNRQHGVGFEETWLYGLPLLTLDQLWVSRDLEAATVKSQRTLRSDHLRMTFRVAPLGR